ncbi:MAG: amino acid permease [Rhizobiaceae bacterium]
MSNGRLGTFGGVFTPSILTILGLILFLRLGYVVGTVGLGQALLIILLASSISILTSISMAAIATNLEVKGGGVYYIISRTLGLPFGGAIGLVLFVAQAISVGFYCVGFAEGIGSLMGVQVPIVLQGIAAAAVLAMLAVAWFGAEWATRFQYVVMALLAAAIVSFAAGAAGFWSPTTLRENIGPLHGWESFWIAFAIFFPAVTGFTQGVNMSGDLADPGRSIPRGTALAVGLSLVIYLGAAVLLAAALPRVELMTDNAAMKQVSAFSGLIDAGIVAATLSSALASLLGAPRILQSLAKDRVFSFLRPFAEAEPDNNPVRGLLLTAGIALAVVALGNLNLIAGVVAMFFVVTYGLLNYATYFEARGQSPSFRPSLRWYRPWMSLLGGIVSVGVMLAINLPAGLAAAAVVFAIFQYLTRTAVSARWSDGQRSYNLQLVRQHLLAASERVEHARDWRPQILAFSDDKERRGRLLTFANWIEGNSGLTTVVRVIEGKGRHARRARMNAERELAGQLAAEKLRAFPLVVMGQTVDAVVPIVIQSAGIGPTRINTVLVNWPEMADPDTDSPEYRRYLRNLNTAYSLDCNLLVFDANDAEWGTLERTGPEARTIDVWWRDDRTGQLMLVLAYLLTRNDAWRNATIRLVVAAHAGDGEAQRQHAEQTLKEVRIAGEILAVKMTNGDSTQLVEVSRTSSIVFMELKLRRGRFVDWLDNDLSDLLPGLPLCVLAIAAGDLDLAADPDEGEESRRAAVRDALDDALEKRDASARRLAKALAARNTASAAKADSTVDAADLSPDIGDAEAALAEDEAALAKAIEAAEELGVTPVTTAQS